MFTIVMYLHDTDNKYTYFRCVLYRCHTASPLQGQRAPHTVGEAVAVQEAVAVGDIKRLRKVVRCTCCLIYLTHMFLSHMFMWWYSFV